MSRRRLQMGEIERYEAMGVVGPDGRIDWDEVDRREREVSGPDQHADAVWTATKGLPVREREAVRHGLHGLLAELVSLRETLRQTNDAMNVAHAARHDAEREAESLRETLARQQDRITELEAALTQAYDDVDRFAAECGVDMRVGREVLSSGAGGPVEHQ